MPAVKIVMLMMLYLDIVEYRNCLWRNLHDINIADNFADDDNSNYIDNKICYF